MKQTRFFRSCVAMLLLATFVTTSTGCIVSLGNREHPHKRDESTLGQELIDLKAARDSGAIDPDEYERERRRLLNE